jgi:CrcB protein
VGLNPGSQASGPLRPTRPAHHQPRLLALVGLGGALGTGTRAALAQALGAPLGSWPWSTFAVNLTGAFLLGLLLETLAGRGRDEGRLRGIRLTLGTGFLGGYTTYSALAVETLHLSPLLAAGYAAGTVAFGLAAAALGRRCAPHPPAPVPGPAR